MMKDFTAWLGAVTTAVGALLAVSGLALQRMLPDDAVFPTHQLHRVFDINGDIAYSGTIVLAVGALLSMIPMGPSSKI